MPRVRVRVPARAQNYEIKIGAGLVNTVGPEIRACLGPDVRRVALVSNQTVFSLYGRAAITSLRHAGLAAKELLVAEGERHKSFRSLEKAVAFLSEHKLERNDAVVSLGGGVVGDLAGFASAIYLRGISLIQAPTTLLAQIDASVGGKTGINLPSGKNLVGAFHQPRLVLIDTSTLRTLPARELTSGWCEAVKQGAVGGRELFNQTVSILRSIDFSLCADRGKSTPTKIYATQLSATIAAHCRFKASIVAADERENPTRTDRRSRRILNFGHTTAHALESVTGYRRFRHGEAVGYGMLVAAEISKSLGMLPSGELESIREAVALCGRLPRADDLPVGQVMKAMAGDKKSLAGKLKWILLERIGRPRIVDGDQIKARVIHDALRAGLR